MRQYEMKKLPSFADSGIFSLYRVPGGHGGLGGRCAGMYEKKTGEVPGKSYLAFSGPLLGHISLQSPQRPPSLPEPGSRAGPPAPGASRTDRFRRPNLPMPRGSTRRRGIQRTRMPQVRCTQPGTTSRSASFRARSIPRLAPGRTSTTRRRYRRTLSPARGRMLIGKGSAHAVPLRLFGILRAHPILLKEPFQLGHL